MRFTLYLTLLFSLLMFAGCDNDASDCSDIIVNDCFPNPPAFADLTLELTINDENRFVPVEIFEGDYDDPNRFIFIQDTVPFSAVGPGNEVIYTLPIQRWNIAVTYMHAGKRIIALDSRRLRTRREDDCAGFTCFQPVHREANMRLKTRD